ncbi:MAG: sugar-binding domain-containing protein [Planctomycetota bacterium]
MSLSVEDTKTPRSTQHTARSTRLDSAWTVRQDPHERGRKDTWQTSAFVAVDWVKGGVPGTMQEMFGAGAAPVCWYRRLLRAGEIERGPGQRVWLRFESVATDATAWVNGREVGRHIGDWVPFQFDIGDALHSDGRDNELVIRADRMAPGKEVWIDGAPVQGGHITKGFHDLLSIHKGGIWLSVYLDVTGGLTLMPDGLGVLADSRTGRVEVDVELQRNVGGGSVELDVVDPQGKKVASLTADVKDGADSVHVQADVTNHVLWQPDSPLLYRIDARLIGSDGRVSQLESTRFGFRRVEVGGKDGRQILLNGRPIFLSGMLDWGHEPRHISPTATPDELRERFKALRERGFNLVCICMWYPPKYFYDIADEMGMLIWQEHPVWKSPMGDEHIPDYQRQFTKFFRRDRNHPSVVMVSGSCEHERFNPKLATWWWGRVRSLMPDRIAQIQTAFFAWTDLTKTDAYDEHTYDSSGRWTHYLADLQGDLAKLPPRPFVMGESILYTHWPNVTELLAKKDASGAGPWWKPLGLEAAARFEARVVERFGASVLERFKRQARRYHLEGRKFQFELFRGYANHAGLVMNHLRDVAACRCGFQDEMDRWYFTPGEMKPWLGAAPLLIRTPGHLRGFVGGDCPIEIGVSNFSGAKIDAKLSGTAGGAPLAGLSTLAAAPGEVAWQSATLRLPSVTSPKRLEIQASLAGAESNAWTLWAFPTAAKWPQGAARLGGEPFTPADRELEFEDRGYSSGWGSPVRSWTPLLPDPAEIAPGLPEWKPADAGVRCVLAHKLTSEVVDFLVGGGRVVHLVSRAKGSAPVKFVNMWGQLPLILEQGPMGPGDSEWIADLLDHDLSRRSLRAVPVGELGLEESFEPIVRLVYCHDIVDRPRVLDFVSTARVSKGLLILSGVDHSTPAGRYMLDRLLGFAASDAPESSGHLDESIVRQWSLAK